MLDYISKNIINDQDDLEACDMDLDHSSDEIVIPAGCEPKPEVEVIFSKKKKRF